MPILTLESTDNRVHLIKEMTKTPKGSRMVSTKCGLKQDFEVTSCTVWDIDVTCPDCAIPWV